MIEQIVEYNKKFVENKGYEGLSNWFILCYKVL